MSLYDVEHALVKSHSWKNRFLGYRRRGFSVLGIVLFFLMSLALLSTIYTFNISSSKTINAARLNAYYKQYVDSIQSSLINDCLASQNNAAIQNVQYERANATILSLVKNDELWKMVQSIRDIEDRFNNKFHYDWVFLNEEEFSKEFINVTSTLVSGKTHYGKIPQEQWSFPDNLDINEYRRAKLNMINKKIIYGGLDSYRHMCRFNSGFFYKHPLLLNYKYYWRVEPNIKLYCDVNYDPFKFMIEHNKLYGFTIALKEVKETIPTLWKNVQKFVNDFPQYIAKDNLQKFITNDSMSRYNLCHFWSNFEIASLDFFRSEPYEKFFEQLDRTNGFYYERWGDAPIHSIAVSLFLDKSLIHMFDDFGYYHNPYASCPTNMNVWKLNRCSCDFNKDFTFSLYSCASSYFDIQGKPKPDDWKKKSKHAAPIIG